MDDMPQESRYAKATLGGGCFWCLEAAYEQIRGVESVVSGYSGGTNPDPTYEQVCSGRTGHVEVVRLAFDPEIVSYRDLLEIFFTIHDPTTLNRQGADVGTQYRSVIFYHDQEQKEIAEELIRDLEGQELWPDPIVTAIEAAPAFYTAEAHHQTYYRRNPRQPYCQVVIVPKLAKLRQKHFERLREADDDRVAARPHSYQPHPRNPVDHGGIAE